MSWTKISKPNSSTYTNVNAQGKEQYDQPSLSYDDANTFYDGVNQSEWTNLSKPNNNSWHKIAKPI
jgi:hypothetical protein